MFPNDIDILTPSGINNPLKNIPVTLVVPALFMRVMFLERTALYSSKI